MSKQNIIFQCLWGNPPDFQVFEGFLSSRLLNDDNLENNKIVLFGDNLDSRYVELFVKQPNVEFIDIDDLKINYRNIKHTGITRFLYYSDYIKSNIDKIDKILVADYDIIIQKRLFDFEIKGLTVYKEFIYDEGTEWNHYYINRYEEILFCKNFLKFLKINKLDHVICNGAFYSTPVEYNNFISVYWNYLCILQDNIYNCPENYQTKFLYSFDQIFMNYYCYYLNYNNVYFNEDEILHLAGYTLNNNIKNINYKDKTFFNKKNKPYELIHHIVWDIKKGNNLFK